MTALAAGNLLASVTLASPVEDLIAGGFGSLTSQPVEMQNVQGIMGPGLRVHGGLIFTRDWKTAEGRTTSGLRMGWYTRWLSRPGMGLMRNVTGKNPPLNGSRSIWEKTRWLLPRQQILGTAVAADTATTSTTRSTSNINSLEALPYIFVPMTSFCSLIDAGVYGECFLVIQIAGQEITDEGRCGMEIKRYAQWSALLSGHKDNEQPIASQPAVPFSLTLLPYSRWLVVGALTEWLI